MTCPPNFPKGQHTASKSEADLSPCFLDSRCSTIHHTMLPGLGGTEYKVLETRSGFLFVFVYWAPSLVSCTSEALNSICWVMVWHWFALMVTAQLPDFILFLKLQSLPKSPGLGFICLFVVNTNTLALFWSTTKEVRRKRKYFLLDSKIHNISILLLLSNFDVLTFYLQSKIKENKSLLEMPVFWVFLPKVYETWRLAFMVKLSHKVMIQENSQLR